MKSRYVACIVGIYAFGTQKITLPAGGTGDVVVDCTPTEDFRPQRVRPSRGGDGIRPTR